MQLIYPSEVGKTSNALEITLVHYFLYYLAVHNTDSSDSVETDFDY